MRSCLLLCRFLDAGNNDTADAKPDFWAFTFIHSFVRPEEPILSSRAWRLRSAARKICHGRRNSAAQRACPWCARHGHWIGGESPLRSELVATAS